METVKERFGMGLIQMLFAGNTGFGHNGRIDGFNSMFAYFHNSNISLAYTANDGNLYGNDVVLAVLSAVFDKPFEIPEFKTKTYEATDEDLDKYLGVYSSTQFPLKMTITKVNSKLFGQATGQPAFPLEATEKDKFEFVQAGIIIEFNPTDKTLLLKQGGGTFKFAKED